jgi:hypothetical protein
MLGVLLFILRGVESGFSGDGSLTLYPTLMDQGVYAPLSNYTGCGRSGDFLLTERTDTGITFYLTSSATNRHRNRYLLFKRPFFSGLPY